MSPEDARLLERNGRILIAVKRQGNDKPSSNYFKVNATYSEPEEKLMYEAMLPHEITDLLIFRGNKVIYGFNYEEKYEYELDGYNSDLSLIQKSMAEGREKVIAPLKEDFLNKIKNNTLDHNQNNVVHLAIWEKKLFLLDYLPEAQYRLFNEKNKFGLTPKSLAQENPKAVEKLKKIGIIN